MNRNSKNAVTDNKTNNNGGIIMNNTMTMDVFASKIKEAVNGILGNGYEVKVQDVTKNNDTHLTGLMIKVAEDPVAPTIYLEQYLEDYRTGNSDIESISKQIVSVYERSAGKVTFDVSSVTDYSACKDRICFKLINAIKNEQLLSEAPHVIFQDLAIIFFIYLGKESALGSASITIKNHLMDLWNISTETLFDIAKTNTQRMFSARVRPMSSVVFGLMNMEADAEKNFYDMESGATGLNSIYVCGNENEFWGAGAILYDGLLKGIAEDSGADHLYIIPSSIHESLLIPFDVMEVSALKNMVKEVNSTVVAPEEILSNNVYIYHADTDSIEIA